MDLENLSRAREIARLVDDYQEACDKLDSKSARIFVSRDSRCDEVWCVCLWEESFLKDLRHLIDEHIEALLEEAKTL